MPHLEERPAQYDERPVLGEVRLAAHAPQHLRIAAVAEADATAHLDDAHAEHEEEKGEQPRVERRDDHLMPPLGSALLLTDRNGLLLARPPEIAPVARVFIDAPQHHLLQLA